MDAQATQGGVVLTQPRAEFVVQPAQPATQHVTQPGQPAGVYINPTTQYVVQPVMIYPGPSYPATQATKF